MEEHFEVFIANLRANVEAFEQYWREENLKNPDMFPMRMGSGAWDEQFMIFEKEQ